MWEQKRMVNFSRVHHLLTLFNCLIWYECFPWACYMDNRCIYERWVIIGQSHFLSESMWLPVIWSRKYLLKAFLGYVSSRNRVSWQNGMHSSTEFFQGKLAACIKETFLMPLSPMLSPWVLLYIELNNIGTDFGWKVSFGLAMLITLTEKFLRTIVVVECVCVCDFFLKLLFFPPNMSKGAWHLSWQWHEFCSGLSWRDFNTLTSRILLKYCFLCLVLYFGMNVQNVFRELLLSRQVFVLVSLGYLHYILYFWVCFIKQILQFLEGLTEWF